MEIDLFLLDRIYMIYSWFIVCPCTIIMPFLIYVLFKKKHKIGDLKYYLLINFLTLYLLLIGIVISRPILVKNSQFATLTSGIFTYLKGIYIFGIRLQPIVYGLAVALGLGTALSCLYNIFLSSIYLYSQLDVLDNKWTKYLKMLNNWVVHILIKGYVWCVVMIPLQLDISYNSELDNNLGSNLLEFAKTKQISLYQHGIPVRLREERIA